MGAYILFGAGQYGKKAIKFLGKENIECFIDNNSDLRGKRLEDIDIFAFQDFDFEMRAKDKKIVITVSPKSENEIARQLEGSGINNYVCFSEFSRQVIRQKILSRTDYISIYRRAVAWIRENTVQGHGIICHSNLRKIYPEVTGYFIPSLIKWGYRDMAVSFAKWLCSIQESDGSWHDAEGKEPYIFDSAQIVRGLVAVRDICPEVDEVIKRGCDWILGNMREDGRLVSPRNNDFGDEKIFSELIHVYCLSPIVSAGKILGIPEYEEKACRILNYYKINWHEKIVNFNLLSHFYAYVIEGFLDMGEEGIVREAMNNLAEYQSGDGAVPAFRGVDWVCSTGLFQLALIWFRLGDIERGNKSFSYACKLQNQSGGWFGSYLSEKNPHEVNSYFPDCEISWASKYFLDALYWKNKAEFELSAHMFKDNLPVSDGRYSIIEALVRGASVDGGSRARVADIGCGKGAYLKNLYRKFPNIEYSAVDLSEAVMQYLSCEGIEKRQGTLTNIPYEDDTFDLTYTCEALEHAVDIENAIREMARVTKCGGKIAVIDKNVEMLGYFEIGEWEQWFDEAGLKRIMLSYCEGVDVEKKIDYESPANGLFYAWIGKVKEK